MMKAPPRPWTTIPWLLSAALATLLSLAPEAAHGATLTAPQESPTSAARPNIVLILADDLGYGDLGVYGSKTIQTPHIDALASTGVRLTAGYVAAAVCSPSRAALMSGRYPQRFGYEFNPSGRSYGLPLDQPTIAERLQEAGYTTGLVGKWQLGTSPERHPLARGFDEFFGMMSGTIYIEPGAPGVESFVPYGELPSTRQRPLFRGRERVEESEYLTDIFTREALDFIDRHSGKPFFLYLAHYAPHVPLQATAEYLDRYRHIEDAKSRIFAAMVSALDDSVGAVMARLREHHLDERTLVVFLSDNGCALYTRGACSNGSLNGGKRYFWEGGIRVPFMLRWPGRIPAGVVYEHPAISMDLSATILAAGGVDTAELELDGEDLLPLLSSSPGPPPHERLFWRAGPNWAIRQGSSKLWVVNRTTEEAIQSLPMAGALLPGWTAPRNSPHGQLRLLYNLDSDLGERRSLAAESAELLAELEAAWKKWNSENTEPMWNSNRGTAVAIDGVPVEIIF